MAVTSNACLAQRTRRRGTGEALLNVELEMSRTTTSPTDSTRDTLRHISLDSHLTTKDFLSLALMAAVPHLIVTRDVITILEESFKLNTSRFRQTQLENKILQVRIRHVPSEHLIPLRLCGRLSDDLHFFDQLSALVVELRERHLLIIKGFPTLEN